MCLSHWFGIENLFCGLVDIETTGAGSDMDSLILQSDDKNVPELQNKIVSTFLVLYENFNMFIFFFSQGMFTFKKTIKQVISFEKNLSLGAS